MGSLDLIASLGAQEIHDLHYFVVQYNSDILLLDIECFHYGNFVLDEDYDVAQNNHCIVEDLHTDLAQDILVDDAHEDNFQLEK